ncbi:MAG: S8 family serine peptidase [Deltaproteobacteria bacterium]|nr:S8 family serine peptidase [Deltaproteobacteria bacterium]
MSGGRAATVRVAAWIALGTLLAVSAAAAPPVHARARIGARLESALHAPVPAEGIAIRVSLRRDDLPQPGSLRSQRVRARQDEVLSAAAPGGFRLKHRYQSLSGFAGWAKPQAIEAFLRHSAVRAIHLDGPVFASLGQGGALIGANTMHALGFTGAGINVAVLDTGIDTNHPGLQDDLVAEACFCDAHPSPQHGACCPNGQLTQTGPGSAEDDNGHGTNVSGVITSPSGIAPDAGIVAVKVLSSGGGGRDSSIDMGIDWVLTNHALHGIRVVNMSLGDGGEHSDPNASACSGHPNADGIADLAAAGVVTFVASGNDGHDDGISAPACIAEAISVGGVYDASLGSIGWCGNRVCTTALCTDTAHEDVFVCHSNSDEILDVLAPNWETTTTDVGGGFTSFGGTSAASPYAAAQAALLLEADLSLTTEQIRTRMKAFGPMVTNPDNGLSFPRTDIAGALLDLIALCGNGELEPGEQCDDGNTNPGDCCSASCQWESSSSSCDDASLCTENDACDGSGTCAGTAIDLASCDDGIVCTADACDALEGCTHTPIPNCSIEIPTTPPGGRLILVALVASLGASLLWGRPREA